jgi:hypothetical protein
LQVLKYAVKKEGRMLRGPEDEDQDEAMAEVREDSDDDSTDEEQE